MSRRRSISTDISVDPKLAYLAEEHGVLPLLLYTWAIPHADDYGRLTNDPMKFRLLVCPALAVKSADVDAALSQIAGAGLWTREGDVIQFPPDAWYRHQSYVPAHKRPRTATEPPEEGQETHVCRETPQITDVCRETPQITSSPSLTPSLTPTPSEEEIPPAQPRKAVRPPPPTLGEVSAYFTERGFPRLAERFWNAMDAKGWKERGSPIVRWESTAANWILSEKNGHGNRNGDSSGRNGHSGPAPLISKRQPNAHLYPT